MRSCIGLTTALILALSFGACDKKKTTGTPDVTTDGETDTTTDTATDAPEDSTVTDVPEDTAVDTEPDSVDECNIYPTGTTGFALGDIIADLSWQVGNTASEDLACGDGMLDLHDLYSRSVTNGGDLTGLFVFVTAGWCPWCSVEAPSYEAMATALAADGILFVALVTETNSPGAPADGAFANTYASTYGFTFPTVAGTLATNYWPPADVASGNVGYPAHLFIDLRDMRIYGRYGGSMSGSTKIIDYICDELGTDPQWASPGVRAFDFDCAPSTGTETEPNSLNDTPEDGSGFSTSTYTLEGVFCPPAIGDGLLVDEDIVDLGTLAAGDVIDVSMVTTGTSDAYPFIELIRINAAGTATEWSTLGPVHIDGSEASRQWVIDTAGHYVVAGLDGRSMSGFHYGSSTTPPDADACCEGGPDYTYELTVDTFTLAATDGGLTPGSNTTGAFTAPGDLVVYSMDVTSGSSYSVTMNATISDNLDPYLVVVDAATGAVLGFNDDINYSGGNYNSQVSWTASATGSVLVAASYWVVSFNGTPGFTLIPTES